MQVLFFGQQKLKSPSISSRLIVGIEARQLLGEV